MWEIQCQRAWGYGSSPGAKSSIASDVVYAAPNFVIVKRIVILSEAKDLLFAAVCKPLAPREAEGTPAFFSQSNATAGSSPNKPDFR
jgi:hypothetical protein